MSTINESGSDRPHDGAEPGTNAVGPQPDVTSTELGGNLRLSPLGKRMTMEVKGRHLSEGRPVTVTMNDQEICRALSA